MSQSDYAASKELARANREFYRAFEAFDSKAMRALWLDDPGVTCVHPGGELLIGSERVLGSWDAIFQSGARVRFALEDVELFVEGTVGWVHLYERLREADADPAEDAPALAATNIFLLRDGVWRMQLHHASPVARRFYD